MKKVFKSKYLANIIAVIFFCIILLTMEAAAYFLVPHKTRIERILSILEQDRQLFWKQRSNLNTIFEGVPIKTNDLGFRNRKIISKKKKDAFRIVCLGASPTFGWGVNEKQVYSFQLEQLLKQKYTQQKEIEVINAGVIGYSSHQGLQLLKKEIIKIAPDIVTVAYVINDVDKYRFFRSNGKSDKVLKAKNRVAVYTENFLDQSNIVRAMRKIKSQYQPGDEQYFGTNNGNKYVDTRRVSRSDYESNLREIIQIATHEGIKVVFIKMPVNLPARTNISNEMWQHAEEYILSAVASLEHKNYRQAVTMLNKAVVLNSDSAKAQYYLGISHEKLRRKEDADAYYESSIKKELLECGRLGKIYNEIMEKVASEENISLVDVVSVFNEYLDENDADLFLEERNDSIHPSALGHTLISKAIYKSLVDEYIIGK